MELTIASLLQWLPGNSKQELEPWSSINNYKLLRNLLPACFLGPRFVSVSLQPRHQLIPPSLWLRILPFTFCCQGLFPSLVATRNTKVSIFGNALPQMSISDGARGKTQVKQHTSLRNFTHLYHQPIPVLISISCISLGITHISVLGMCIAAQESSLVI